MKTFDKYPLYAQNKEDATGGIPVLDEKKRSASKQTTVSKVDDDDIDGDENKDKNQEANREPTKINGGDPQEPTRGKMASVFISGFFMIIMVCFIYAAWQQASLSEVKDMVIAVIGALSGLVGFVIGYYFKTTAKS